MQISIVTVTSPGVDHDRLFTDLASFAEPMGSAASGDEAVHLIIDTVPDVAIIDEAAEGPATPALLAFIKEHAPITRVVLLHAEDAPGAYRSLSNGALASVSDDTTAAEVADIVRGVARGEARLSARMAAYLIADIDAAAGSPVDVFAPPPTLTLTEREVLTQLARGHTPSQIAEQYNVTARLVNLHTGFAVSKLHHYGIERRRITSLDA